MHTQKRFFSVLGWSLVLGFFLLAVPAGAANSKKDWTFMVFINGNNDLDDYGSMNINQMEKVGSTENLNIVVQWASNAASTTKRLYITKDDGSAVVTSPVVQELPDVDMGNKDNLLDFIKWSSINYPAEHYFVVVWNHGSGWHLTGSDISVLDISYDEKTGHHITTEELGQVMQDAASFLGQKIDIYGSDACLMAMIEIAQEMAGAVDTFVGSEETIPLEGWPYDAFLARWVANPRANAHEIGTMLSEAYKEFYAQRSGQTFSVIDMNELPALIERVGALGAKLATLGDFTAVKAAASKSERFALYDYADIGDLIDNLAKETPSLEVRTELDGVSRQLSKTVVTHIVTSQNTRANGLAIWWPTYASNWNMYQRRYRGLKFDKLSNWSAFLHKLF